MMDKVDRLQNQVGEKNYAKMDDGQSAAQRAVRRLVDS